MTPLRRYNRLALAVIAVGLAINWWIRTYIGG